MPDHALKVKFGRNRLPVENFPAKSSKQTQSVENVWVSGQEVSKDWGQSIVFEYSVP